MQLGQLLEDLPGIQIRGPIEVEIGKLVCDSRCVEPGDLFVAIRGGQEEDRHQFVSEALARGARAVVVEEEIDSGEATRVLVANCRQALARMAARYYGYPGNCLHLVGITGTKGKTTTALLVRQGLEAAGWPCGYLGTLGGIVGDRFEALANTTPEAHELHRQLRAMVERGKKAAVLEVSSHGLALERVAGLPFEVAIFTNLSRDHLDFHQTEANYFAAKARLFEELEGEAKAVINLDDPVAPALLARVKVPALTYGRQPQAQVQLLSVRQTAVGMQLEVRTPLGESRIETALVGRFNAYNAMAALTAGLALGLDLEAVSRGIGAVDRIPGRFERVVAGQDFQVIVDYAHTPASLENVLQTARELVSGRLICVFGCGGNRDRGKRPLMGRIASQEADLVILTSDNPRGEDPEAIIAEIAAGLLPTAEVQIEPDRRRAIAMALQVARAGDLVLIAGKGHETVQILADRVIPFDDKEVVRQLLVAQVQEQQIGAGGP